jgi:hypothetical protein
LNPDLFSGAENVEGLEGTAENRVTGTDFTVVRFDGASGRERWRKVINGSASDVDAAFAITTDVSGMWSPQAGPGMSEPAMTSRGQAHRVGG